MAQGLWFEARCGWTVVMVDRGNDSATATSIGPTSGRILKLRSHAALLCQLTSVASPNDPFSLPTLTLTLPAFAVAQNYMETA